MGIIVVPKQMSEMEIPRRSSEILGQVSGRVAVALALLMPIPSGSQASPPLDEKAIDLRLPPASHEDQLVACLKERLVTYQALESDLANAARRLERDIEREVREGKFLIPSESALGESEIVIDAIPDVIKNDLSLIEFEMRSRSDRPVGGLNRLLESCVLSAMQCPTTEAECALLVDARKLSPAEIHVQELLHEALIKSGRTVYQNVSPEEFARAMQAFQDWVPNWTYRPSNDLVEQYRGKLLAQIDELGLPEEARQTYVRQFDSFYDALPSRRCVAYTTAKSRTLGKLQDEEDRIAAGFPRSPRNIFVEFNKGRIFLPDLQPQALLAPEFYALIPRVDGEPDPSDFDLRPSHNEQGQEIDHLRQFLFNFGVERDVIASVVSMRLRAWQEMPESLPKRVVQLLGRDVSQEELEVVLCYYELRLRATTESSEEYISNTLRACKDYYDSKPKEGIPSDGQTFNDRRRNYEAMMRAIKSMSDDQSVAERFSESEIARRLERFDRDFR